MSWLGTTVRPFSWDSEQEAAARAWHALLSNDAKVRLELMLRVDVAVSQHWLAPGGAEFIRNHLMEAADIRADRTSRLQSVGDRWSTQGTGGKLKSLRALVEGDWIQLLDDEPPRRLGHVFRYRVRIDLLEEVPLFAVPDAEVWDEGGELTAAIPARMWAVRYGPEPCRAVESVVARWGPTPMIRPADKPTPRMVEVGR